MSQYEFDTDQNSGRPAPRRFGIGRRVLTLVIVVLIAALAVWAMIRAGRQNPQPAAQMVPAPAPADTNPDNPSGNEEIEIPAVVGNPETAAEAGASPVETVVATAPSVPAEAPKIETPAETVQLAVSAPAPAETATAAKPAPAEVAVEVIDPKGGAIPAADSEEQQLYHAAGTALAARDFAKARDLARQALARPEMKESNPLYRSLLTILGKANVAIALTPAAAPEKVKHRIADGDSVSVLARRYGTTTEAIALSNNLKDPNRIRFGYELNIYPGKWSVTVDVAKRTLTLYNDGALFKVYEVGVGREAKTPVGTFRISDRIEKPAWTNGNRQIPYGDPENVLGTRWMPLTATGGTPAVRGIGLHGTWDDATVSQPVSNGCVRLHNGDIEELFNLVPVNTPVTIQ